MLTPSMFMAHEPQMPSRHERRNVRVLSISFLILMSASSVIGPQLHKNTRNNIARPSTKKLSAGIGGGGNERVQWWRRVLEPRTTSTVLVMFVAVIGGTGTARGAGAGGGLSDRGDRECKAVEPGHVTNEQPHISRGRG